MIALACLLALINAKWAKCAKQHFAFIEQLMCTRLPARPPHARRKICHLKSDAAWQRNAGRSFCTFRAHICLCTCTLYVSAHVKTTLIALGEFSIPQPTGSTGSAQSFRKIYIYTHRKLHVIPYGVSHFVRMDKMDSQYMYTHRTSHRWFLAQFPCHSHGDFFLAPKIPPWMHSFAKFTANYFSKRKQHMHFVGIRLFDAFI